MIWGYTFFGKTDRIPSVGFVATRFVHFCCFPAIPVESHFVTKTGVLKWESVEIPLSTKSMLLAWFRALIFIGMFLVPLTLSQLFPAGSRLSLWVACSCFFVVFALLILSYRLRYFATATYDRACEIADAIGFDDEQRVNLDLVYGMIDMEIADVRLYELGISDENPFESASRL